jgi:hypothetical protein
VVQEPEVRGNPDGSWPKAIPNLCPLPNASAALATYNTGDKLIDLT